VVSAYNPANPTQNQPIAFLDRAAPVTRGGTTQIRVTSIDPRPANAAVSSFAAAPNDGFFSQAMYRGGFGANENWLCSWTATQAYGFNVPPPGGCVVVLPCPSDINHDNVVNTADLLAVINTWGPCPGCPTDLNGDGNVNTADLLAVINAWGNCP
jgi:hypothetical protein